jgi:protein-S-isoprenylcysteine O-methyltransferase Ste14
MAVFTKFIALTIQCIFVALGSLPPDQTSQSFIRDIKTEGIVNWARGNAGSLIVPATVVYLSCGYTLLMIWQLFSSRSNPPLLTEWTVLDFIALILIVGGGALRTWSFRVPGPAFSHNIRQIDAQGPYKYVRHPGYTGSAITMLGVACFIYRLAAAGPFWFPYPVGLLIAALCVFLPASQFYDRVLQEEARMRKRFGKAWDSFASTRKRFVPCVY